MIATWIYENRDIPSYIQNYELNTMICDSFMCIFTTVCFLIILKRIGTRLRQFSQIFVIMILQEFIWIVWLAATINQDNILLNNLNWINNVLSLICIWLFSWFYFQGIVISLDYKFKTKSGKNYNKCFWYYHVFLMSSNLLLVGMFFCSYYIIQVKYREETDF